MNFEKNENQQMIAQMVRTRQFSVRRLQQLTLLNALVWTIGLVVLSLTQILPEGLAQTTNPMSGTGLQILGAADLLGEFGAKNTATHPNLLDVREVELGVFAPADTLFDGALILAAHNESGEKTAEIHEAYLGSSKLIPNSRFRFGYYFLNFGRLNSIHRHDWPFTSAPKVHETFFAKEAVTDGGAEYSWLVPFLPFYLDLTAGIASGYNFGHAHTRGPAPLIPTHYLRAIHYQSIGDVSGTQFGLNYIGRKTESEGQMSLIGFDWVMKIRDLSQLRWLIQGEAWYRNLGSSQELGGYLFANYGMPDSRLELGLRVEALSDLSLEDVAGDSISNVRWGVVPQVTFRSSEFVQLRASIETDIQTRAGSTTLLNHVLQGQAVFLLGAHPAHEF
jgi:hypothetical protein